MQNLELKKKVLVIDDDSTVLAIIQNRISQSPFDCHLVSDPIEGLKHMLSFSYDCIVTDLTLPNITGFQFIDRARDLDSLVPFVVVSKFIDFQNIRTCLEKGVFDIVEKPIHSKRLMETIEIAISNGRAFNSNRTLPKFVSKMNRISTESGYSRSLELGSPSQVHSFQKMLFEIQASLENLILSLKPLISMPYEESNLPVQLKKIIDFANLALAFEVSDTASSILVDVEAGHRMTFSDYDYLLEKFETLCDRIQTLQSPELVGQRLPFKG